MNENLIINIHRTNIDVVFSSFDYHSQRSTLLNTPIGSYAVFITRDSANGKYEILGYFVKINQTVDNNSWRARRWGKYTFIADPVLSKQIKNLYLDDLLDKYDFDRKFIDKSGKRAIGMATQGPSYLSNHDLKIILENANTFTDAELIAIHQKLNEEKTAIYEHKNNFSNKYKILEENLEDFTVSQIENLEPGLKLVGRQVATDAGRIDILCKDKNANFVVIELKRGRISDQVVGQISRYMGWIAENETHDLEKVRGIIVASESDKNLDYALKANSHILLKTFALSFR